MAQQKQTQEQDMNQLLKVRRDKLKELQESGKDPFVITKYDVTITARRSKTIMRSWKTKKSPWRGV